MKRFFYTDYYADEEGNVYSKKKGVLRKLKANTKVIQVCMHGKRKKMDRGRLVLLCFEPRIDFIYKKCRHVDGNKKNNHINNLEWI